LDLGPLVELVIGHDQVGGLMDAWHLEQVDIIDPSGKVRMMLGKGTWHLEQ
jgi:hypothetical protein